jgi:hypothetical protein
VLAVTVDAVVVSAGVLVWNGRRLRDEITAMSNQYELLYEQSRFTRQQLLRELKEARS